MDGFSFIRADKGESSGKDKGGGVCMWVTDGAHNIQWKKPGCNPDAKYLCLSLRTFYLPLEFGNAILCVVYISHDGNASRAALSISDDLRGHHTFASYSLIQSLPRERGSEAQKKKPIGSTEAFRYNLEPLNRLKPEKCFFHRQYMEVWKHQVWILYDHKNA